MFEIKTCPLKPEKICSNVVNDKCMFQIEEVEKCPLLMWDAILNKGSEKEDEDKLKWRVL